MKLKRVIKYSFDIEINGIVYWLSYSDNPPKYRGGEPEWILVRHKANGYPFVKKWSGFGCLSKLIRFMKDDACNNALKK